MNTKNLSIALLIIAMVLLTAACGGGSNDPDTSLTNTTPTWVIIADAGRNDFVTTGSRVVLDASNSGLKDENNKPTTSTINYNWTFIGNPPTGATSFPALLNETTVNPNFIPSVDGKYELQLTITSENAKTQTSTVEIIASSSNSRPVANAGKHQQANIKANVILDGSQSRDADADTLSYRWKIISKPEDSNTSLNNETTVQPNFSPDKTGEYQIELIVNDGMLDSDVDTVIVTAEINRSLSVSITSPESGASFTTTDTITLVGEGNDGEGSVLPASALTWKSDKDGVLCQGKSNCAITLSAGSHMITLTGQDSADVTTEAVITVIVTGDAGSLTAGLLAYYPFDGNANDNSDNSRHGEIHGAFLTVDRHNAKNSAYHFDGSHGYIHLKVERSTYPKFSMCAWYQYLGDINAGHQTLFSSGTPVFWVGKAKGNSNIGAQEGNYNSEVAIGTNAWDGEWHHLCYVYNEGAVVLYLDNINVGTANLEQGNGSIRLGRLGKHNEDNGVFFNGIIDEVRLYDHALSPADVNVVFTAEDNTGDVLPLLNGVWEGLASATQDAESTWSIKVTLSANNTFISSPSLNCGGDLELVSQTDNTMLFIATMSYGLTSCEDTGMVELTRLSGSKLGYAWFNVQQSTASLTLAHTDPNPILNTVNGDSRGSVTSDVGGINCGETCRATFETNEEVILTAVYDSGLVPMWVGCLSTDGDTCTVFMNQHRTVILSFATVKKEIETNDSLTEAQDITESTVVKGNLDIDDDIASYNPSNDVDFFRFQVEQQGTFKLSSANPSQQHYLLLYNEQQQEITRVESTAPMITRSLRPGTYYVGVFPNNPEDFVAAIDGTLYIAPFWLYFRTYYTLSFSGAVFGAPLTLDSFEENDSFATAKLIETAESIQGYLDTSNDVDFFSFKVTQQGTFKFSSVHPSHHHYLDLYNEQQQEIASTESTASTAPVRTRSLSPGTYYVGVHPHTHSNNFNLNTPYTLSISEE